MRLFSVLSSITIIYFVTCTAAEGSDQTKHSLMGSPILVYSLNAAHNVDPVARRFLREREANMEERGIRLTQEANVKSFAKKILANFDEADDVYKK
ncbi:secreted RxLR effector peptide protein, putative [Phytophthora infestans T30-4]|uniref:RxLR effector protein n=2 Tax=Phytophthora infestans TaxID=4787 RepID=D0NTI9_PHYIT|nr:secreted RxLR effector peptide protein, putative [Phytophthora infestans T30-4]EEY64940.1 secreted RxLR effector peptide protein, putative [Phytophthora infestans T30-4]KAF4035437.1 RXLR domain-containing protein [Phytophthora infestans]KAF4133360.1 RXLR effector domain-containing protein [Phytophthora infestans]KAI9990526.1 hypothetical protein PInf_018080 [Phytophthora infestans]|eukprot:XP_002897670.1 secreted RxLR effector peptide protein, putative [Phytophthora infestans T30-4]